MQCENSNQENKTKHNQQEKNTTTKQKKTSLEKNKARVSFYTISIIPNPK